MISAIQESSVKKKIIFTFFTFLFTNEKEKVKKYFEMIIKSFP